VRKPRVLQDGACYHVYARANRKELILEPRRAKDLFVTVVKQAKRRFDFDIHNMCILGNHFHFIIRPGEGESLSSIMQWILSVFGMRFNRMVGLSGHVWGERFSSRILANMRQYLEVYAYIDDNPRRAGLVERVEDWLYGRFNLDRIGCGGLIARPPQGLGC
jgi:putative transposase